MPLETVSFTIKGAAFRGEVIGLEPTVKAPANAMSTGLSGQEMTNAVKAPASPTSEGQLLFKGEVVGLEPVKDRDTIPAGFMNGCAPRSAPVRQVGSEGVKPPVPASLVDYAPGVCYFHTVRHRPAPCRSTRSTTAWRVAVS